MFRQDVQVTTTRESADTVLSTFTEGGCASTSVSACCCMQLLLAGVNAEEHLEGTIADPELLMEVSSHRMMS